MISDVVYCVHLHISSLMNVQHNLVLKFPYFGVCRWGGSSRPDFTCKSTEGRVIRLLPFLSLIAPNIIRGFLLLFFGLNYTN